MIILISQFMILQTQVVRELVQESVLKLVVIIHQIQLHGSGKQESTPVVVIMER